MKRQNQCIVVLGEVLFDAFPDGDSLGGAPFNFAWHLQGLGRHPLLVSRLGDDPRGEEIRTAMAGHGLDTTGLQTDATHPTGTVRVTLEDGGGHRFEILTDQAYDHMEAATVLSLVQARAPDLLYFGTLATRQPASRAAVLGGAGTATAIRYLDVNLRPGCWTDESVTDCLKTATVAKLNDDEIEVLAALHRLPADPMDAADALRRRFDLDTVILTRGAAGAAWFDAEGCVQVAAPDVSVVNTVGAGDGFAAVTAVALLDRWPKTVALERAARFASQICQRRGACPDDPLFYAPFRREWELEVGP